MTSGVQSKQLYSHQLQTGGSGEYIAMAIAILGSFIITKYWRYPEVRIIQNQKKLVLNIHYAYFFSGYFLIAFALASWQFWLFSQKF